MMDFLFSLPASSVLGWFFTGVQGIFAWIFWTMRQSFVTRSEFNTNAARITTMENTIKQLPDAKTIHDLSLQMVRLEGDLKAQGPRFDAFNKASDQMQYQLNRIDDFLRERERV